jgi:hypothetical protein
LRSVSMASGPAKVGTMHPALDQALDVFPADTAARAAAALQTLLHDRISDGGEDAWSASRLTGGGFPVEITFTTADDRLRYTLEPAGRSVTPRQRLEAAIHMIDILSPAALPEYVAQAFRSLQRSGVLTFGAWIGGRHSAAESQYKIYAETPDVDAAHGILSAALSAWVAEIPVARLYDRSASLQMVAYSPSSEQWELYYRVKSLTPYHVPGALAPVGLASQTEELLSYVKDAYGYPLGERLPGESVGISYSVRAANAESSASQPGAQSVTLYFFARALWGGDARIRRQFGRFSAALGWDDGRYQKITAGLSSRRIWKTYHGIVGITLLRGGKMALSIGVRPCESPPEGEP